MIETSLNRLEKYLEEENYRGYDPYDALKSPFFKLPVLKNNKLIRFGTQQVVKRFPLNLRQLLFVPKGYNPVTLGLCIQGYGYLIAAGSGQKENYLGKINYLVDELKKLIPAGYSGPCWGYDFDWEARHAKIPAYQPTIVATGIIANGLYETWLKTGQNSLKELIVDSSLFVLKNLNRTYEGDSFCFSYSPFDKQRVFNASMKGARLLAQAYSITNDLNLKKEALNAADFVMKYQNENGSWGYSLAAEGSWIDNYHTGYVLDCLDEVIKTTTVDNYKNNLQKGYQFYKDNFITEEGIPKFYSNRIYPVDCTAAAQTILTLCRFNDLQVANKVAEWMILNMQSKKGNFYFRKYQYHTEKTSFMRWSNAWMFTALSYFIYNLKQQF